LELGNGRCAFAFASLTQLDTKMALHQRGQTEFANAEQARGDHRIENTLCFKIESAAHQSEIEIRAMHDDFLFLERDRQGRQIDFRQRIDQVVAARLATGRVRPIDRHAQLQQTKLFPIAMQTVRFGVDGDTLEGFNL
jgi:hypothetical protein